MKQDFRSGLVAAALVLAFAATQAEARVVAGKELPDQIPVAGKTLQLNGTAVQKLFVFKIYAVGLYLEQPTRDPEQALESDQTKRIRVHVLKNAPKNTVVKALRDGMQKSGADMAALESRIQQLERSLEDVRAGHTLDVTYVPGVGTELTGGGKKMIIEGKDFADALFSNWLGNDPGIRKVREGLVGQ